jgi:hypothetical protein
MSLENIKEPVVIAEFNIDSFAKMLVEILENEGIPSAVSEGNSALQFTFGTTALGDGGIGTSFYVVVDESFKETALAKIEELREHSHEIFHEIAPENFTDEELEYPEVKESEFDGLLKIVDVESSLIAEALSEELEKEGLYVKISNTPENSESLCGGVWVNVEDEEKARDILDKLEQSGK